MGGVRCPLCDVPMREVQRRGVLIDVCPECRGVWLDRGELEKLLSSAEVWEEEAAREFEGPRRSPPEYRPLQEYRPHKRKSLWKELFDFDLFD